MYGPIEHLYCSPVADALANDPAFVQFFFQKVGRSDWATQVRSLHAEQAALRKSKYWWKNVFCSESRCHCPNLRGREIDILAVFENAVGKRIGFHIECKHPTDVFSDGQAIRYRERLACWTQPGRGPKTIPRHEQAFAILICSRENRHKATDISQFDVTIHFEEIRELLPDYPK